jgi:four helix bundle protein
MAGVHRFEDLIAWQLARQLQNEVFAFTSKCPALNDRRYCEQIRDSSRSARRNIAEGFGRYYPKDFGRFMRIAIASLHETKNHLDDGNERHYISDSEHTRLIRLTKRAIKASARLARYLDKAKPRPRENAENPEP